MKKHEAIEHYLDDKPSDYHLAGRMIKLAGIGQLPSSIERKAGDEVESTFVLGAVTADFVYYLDDQADEATCTLMLDRETMKLVSDNFMASNDLVALLQDNYGLQWMSGAVKAWQKDQFVTPEQMTPAIKKALDQVDIQKLTREETKIFEAFLNNGPVKYTRLQSLVAVLCADLDQHSPELATIAQMMRQEPPAPKRQQKPPPGTPRQQGGKRL